MTQYRLEGTPGVEHMNDEHIVDVTTFLNNVTLEEWELAIHTIGLLKKHGPLFNYVGICRNLTEYAYPEDPDADEDDVGTANSADNFDFYEMVDALSIDWEHHSRRMSYPISGKTTWDKDTRQGKLRHELLDYIHEAAIKKLAELVDRNGA